MPFTFRFNVDPATLGTGAYEGGRANAVRANTLESLQAKQRRDMQAAENAMQLANMQRQAEQRNLDRMHDLNRAIYGEMGDYARQRLAGEQQSQQLRDRAAEQQLAEQRQNEFQATRDARLAEYGDIGKSRDFNNQRLLSREEFINEGLKKGELQFGPRQLEYRQKKYDELAAVRTSRALRPHERAAEEAKIISEINEIEPTPVPFDQRPVPSHEVINANTLFLDGSTWKPLGTRQLSPGDVYKSPDGKGGFEDKVFKEQEYKNSLEIEKERQKAQIAANTPPSDKEWIESFAAASNALFKQKSLESAGTGVDPTPPTTDEVIAHMKALKAARDQMFAAPQPGQGPAFGPAAMDPFGIVQKMAGIAATPNPMQRQPAAPQGMRFRDAQTGEEFPIVMQNIAGGERPTMTRNGETFMMEKDANGNWVTAWKLTGGGGSAGMPSPQAPAAPQGQQTKTAEYQGRQYPIITAKDGRQGIVVNGIFMVEE